MIAAMTGVLTKPRPELVATSGGVPFASPIPLSLNATISGKMNLQTDAVDGGDSDASPAGEYRPQIAQIHTNLLRAPNLWKWLR